MGDLVTRVVNIRLEPGVDFTTQDFGYFSLSSEMDNVARIRLLGHHIKIQGTPGEVPSVVHLMLPGVDAIQPNIASNGAPLRSIPIQVNPTIYNSAEAVVISASTQDSPYRSPEHPDRRVSYKIPNNVRCYLALDSNTNYPTTSEINDGYCGYAKVMRVAGDSSVTLAFDVWKEHPIPDERALGRRDQVFKGFSTAI